MKTHDSGKVKAKAPTRISFANGGDTDYYTQLLGKGNCINATINLFSRCEIRRRNDSKVVLMSKETGRKETFDSLDEMKYDDRELDTMKAVVKHFGSRGIEITTDTDAPLESGLGGSAAHVVSMIKAFDFLNGIKRSPEETAKLAYRIERNELKIGGGYQDQWAASYTGMNYMEFLPGKVKLTPLKIKPSVVQELEKRILLVYVKRRKTGHEVHDDLMKNRTKNVEILKEMGRNVISMKNAIESGNIGNIGTLMAKDWDLKKNLASCISNPITDKIFDEAMEAGANGGRFVGAGAGGCALFFCKDKNKVMAALRKFDVKEIPFRLFFGDKR